MPAFIGEEIEPVFAETPDLEKRTGVPTGFKWRGREYAIKRVVKEWHEYGPARPGTSRSPHAQLGMDRGTRGSGRDFYRVILEDGRLVDLYYDRRPKNAKDRKGRWVFFREIGETQA